MPYIGNTDEDRKVMLDVIGVPGVEALFHDIPASVRFPVLNLPAPMSELEILREIEALAARNAAGAATVSFVGGGAYHHFIPSVVDYLSGRGEFATAYTPYQAEASQGTVQTIFEYQSMVSDLLSMDIVNASHYDGATAMAEAAIMSVRVSRSRTRVVMAGTIHPEYLEVSRTYLAPQGISIDTVGRPDEAGSLGPTLEELVDAVDQDTACLIIQNPDFLGRLSDLRGIAERVHEKGALLVIHTDPLAAALFRSPGALGADIVTAEGQPLGIPVSFGGPYLGVFACKEELVRKMPGRLAGQTVDTSGRRGFVLTLNTREQHIRREKATSNICTNQGLMALRAAIYLATMGPAGISDAATLSYQKAHYAASRLSALPGCSINDGAAGVFFKEFILKTPIDATTLVESVCRRGLIPGLPLSTYYPGRTHELLIAVTEMNSRAQIDRLVEAIGAEVGA